MPEIRLSKKGQSRTLALAPGTHVLGRDPACQIPLDSNWVSRRHCQITVGPQGARLQDLGSSNGTFLNQQRIEEAPLAPGDRITLGEYTLDYDPPPLPQAELRAALGANPWFRRLQRAPLSIKVGALTLLSLLLFQQLIFGQAHKAARRGMRTAAMQSARRLTLYLAEKNRNHLVLGNYILLDSESVRQEIGVKGVALANRDLKVLSPLAEASLVLDDPQSVAAAQAQSEEVLESQPRGDGTVVLTTPIRNLNPKAGVYETVGVARLIFSPEDYINALYSEVGSRIASLLLSLLLALAMAFALLRLFQRPWARLRQGLENLEQLPDQLLPFPQLPREAAPLAELINYRLQKERGRFGGSGAGQDNMAQQNQLDQVAGLESAIAELIHAVPLGAALLDREKKIKAINERAAEILEINRREFHRPLAQLTPAILSEPLTRFFAELDEQRRESGQLKIPYGGMTLVCTVSAARNLLGVPLYALLIVEKL